MTTPIYTPTRSMSVRYDGGERYEIAVRHHAVAVDQPATDGGFGQRTYPVELFVASLAGCVAFYCGRYLSRHGVPRDGLTHPADRAHAGFAADVPPKCAPICRETLHHPQHLARPTVAIELAE